MDNKERISIMDKLQNDSNDLREGEKALHECKYKADLSDRQRENFKLWNKARLECSPAYRRKHGIKD